MLLDLGGRELGGALSDGGDLVLSLPGVTLCNGTLLLPDKACMEVAAPDVRLEELAFRGEGPEGNEMTGAVGVVKVEGTGSSVELER